MGRRCQTTRTDLVRRPVKPGADLKDQFFGQWEVLGYAGTKNGHWFRCRCSCGFVGVVHGGELRTGRSPSCGHNGSTYKHGKARRGGKTAEYNTWVMLRNRCNDPAASGYKNYGGRGIKVCPRWDDFENFLADMGPRPSPDMSIERKNNDGDYEPSNCVWATRAEQRRNTRKVIRVTYAGETLCLKDWCVKLGLDYGRICHKVRKGESAERLLFEGKEV